MNRPELELADIVRTHGEAYRQAHPLSSQQAKVLRCIERCRTAALGGHRERCPGCDFTRVSYNSCRDRHCPKCQGSQQHAWVQKRLERLLPVPYFHVVFTLPHELNPLVLQNPTTLYDLLFEAASETLRTLTADPKRLGATVGVTAVLHTWGQNLLLHPHLHCVVTGGGLSRDGQRWIAGHARYFLPVKVLAKMFRGKFLAKLKALHRQSKLKLDGTLMNLRSSREWERWLGGLYQRRWVVYAKAPFGGPEHVFRYLGRYTHRVAITNSRLVAMTVDTVSFEWKDYADSSRTKVMTLSADEFLRRFLLHVLPRGFVRIRHYGLLASGRMAQTLSKCRELLTAAESRESAPPLPKPPTWIEQARTELALRSRCPHCQSELIREPLEDGPPSRPARPAVSAPTGSEPTRVPLRTNDTS